MLWISNMDTMDMLHVHSSCTPGTCIYKCMFLLNCNTFKNAKYNYEMQTLEV